ncbi:hypothetical protein [Thermobifida halotolerans]|nr:hypothetical protein [Thermobifida halotolerans]
MAVVVLAAGVAILLLVAWEVLTTALITTSRGGPVTSAVTSQA